MDAEINDNIFNVVKGYMENKGESSDILVKLCTGTASDQEKNNWCLENGFTVEDSEGVIAKLQEYCQYGYGMAQNIEKEETNVLLQRILQLEKTVALLVSRVGKLEGLENKTFAEYQEI